jgi:DNA-binding NarL/FixJ family response regulator
MVPRILIADDQEVMLSAIRSALQYNSRFEVCGTVMNGAEAIVKAQELHPDLIVLDLAMPVMNGLETARKIASLLPDLPILLYTMVDIPQVKVEAAKAGIREVVFKSDGTHLLLDAVEKALRKEPAVASAADNALPLAVTSIDETDGRTQPESPELPRAESINPLD